MQSEGTGAFLISWNQTEIDELEAAAASALRIGATWAWTGKRLALPLTLPDAPEPRTEQTMNRWVASLVRQALGPEMPAPASDPQVFTVTDGAQRYRVAIIETVPGHAPVLLFCGRVPPQNTELLVVENEAPMWNVPLAAADGGVICFTPGTSLRTPTGEIAVEHLSVGDMVQTKDDGPQPVLWIGHRRLSGARLYAMPHLRPVEIAGGAFGVARPDKPLLVSPQHRLLLSGPAARVHLGEPEVFVTATDLRLLPALAITRRPREITYIHVMLPEHSVVWANGVETESFHPASAAPDTLRAEDLARLLDLVPSLHEDVASYGRYARPIVNGEEAQTLLRQA